MLGLESVGQLVADREFTAVSYPNGKSFSNSTTTERRGKIVIYKTDDLNTVVDTIVGIETANELGVKMEMHREVMTLNGIVNNYIYYSNWQLN